MDHALVQHLNRTAGLAVLLLAACARTEHPPPSAEAPPVTEFWVDPAGNDQGPGTQEAPLRTIAAALLRGATRIGLLPGAHEGEQRLDRMVEIYGAGEGAALIVGHVTVMADGVTIEGVNLGAGLSAIRSQNLLLRRGRVDSGASDDAISLQGSRARLRELELSCGPETCLEVSTSTVELSQLQLQAGPETKRGLRVETSSVTAQGLSANGGSVSQIQLGRMAKMTLRNAQLRGSSGNGLMVLRDSAIQAEEVSIEGARVVGAIFQASQGILRKLQVQGVAGLAVGVAGADVTLADSILASGSDGALNLSAYLDRSPKVLLVGGEVRHGIHGGAFVGAGELRVRGTVFKGTVDPTLPQPFDAISATGLGVLVEVDGARFESPGGFAVALFKDAGGTITATITGPGQGGVYTEQIAAAPVLVHDSRIEGCLAGSGIVALETSDFTVRSVRITGCREAGVLAGQDSRVRVEASGATDNPLYGYAAFGGALLRIRASSARGSKWATYASCGEGAYIEDLGGNRFVGATVRCP